ERVQPINDPERDEDGQHEHETAKDPALEAAPAPAEHPRRRGRLGIGDTRGAGNGGWFGVHCSTSNKPTGNRETGGGGIRPWEGREPLCQVASPPWLNGAWT